MIPIKPGTIVKFLNPCDGLYYDGIVWRVLPEDETNYSVFLRFVDEVIE